MNRKTRWIVLATMIVSVGVAAAGPVRPVPDVTLALDTGSSLRLADLTGKVVLIDFWASWCIPCRTSFPALDGLHKELQNRGLVVVAVNLDEQRHNADLFLADRPHTMTIAFDPQGKAAEAFSLKGMPSTILLDRRGAVRFTHMGYSERTLSQFRSEVLVLLGES